MLRGEDTPRRRQGKNNKPYARAAPPSRWRTTTRRLSSDRETSKARDGGATMLSMQATSEVGLLSPPLSLAPLLAALFWPA